METNNILEYTEKYKELSKNLIDFNLIGSRETTWHSPSNIALIKYWGKYGDQLPRNPSISFTLKNSKTISKVEYRKVVNSEWNIEYYFEGKRNLTFEEKIKNYIIKISKFLPFVKHLDFTIHSQNTFPHSAGIASSASAFSALALCLCTIENELFHTLEDKDDFFRKASFLARLGSGSACRSTYGKLALWGEIDGITDSSNEIAVPVINGVHEVFKTYYDAILIIDSGKKSFSSTVGHSLMQNHPFANSRYQQAYDNLKKLLGALGDGDEKTFAQLVENESLSLHGLMMSSNPPVLLMKPNTLVAISKLVDFRLKHNLDFTYTLDAGPNIHILYPEKIRDEMISFIGSELAPLCENGLWIDDQLSDGPEMVN
jgi:diphosphomevalonate decarboxylase